MKNVPTILMNHFSLSENTKRVIWSSWFCILRSVNRWKNISNSWACFSQDFMDDFLGHFYTILYDDCVSQAYSNSGPGDQNQNRCFVLLYSIQHIWWKQSTYWLNFEFHKPFSLSVYEDREIFASQLHDTITIIGSPGLTLHPLMRHFDNFMPNISKAFMSSIQLNR